MGRCRTACGLVAALVLLALAAVPAAAGPKDGTANVECELVGELTFNPPIGVELGGLAHIDMLSQGGPSAFDACQAGTFSRAPYRASILALTAASR